MSAPGQHRRLHSLIFTLSLILRGSDPLQARHHARELLKKEPPPTREKRVSVISLDDQRIVGSIFKALCQSSATHQDLRRQIFRHMARVQDSNVCSWSLFRDTPISRERFCKNSQENPQRKRKLVVVAHEHKQSQVTSHS
jgi:hypothetical protein